MWFGNHKFLNTVDVKLPKKRNWNWSVLPWISTSELNFPTFCSKKLMKCHRKIGPHRCLFWNPAIKKPCPSKFDLVSVHSVHVHVRCCLCRENLFGFVDWWKILPFEMTLYPTIWSLGYCYIHGFEYNVKDYKYFYLLTWSKLSLVLCSVHD